MVHDFKLKIYFWNFLFNILYQGWTRRTKTMEIADKGESLYKKHANLPPKSKGPFRCQNNDGTDSQSSGPRMLQALQIWVMSVSGLLTNRSKSNQQRHWEAWESVDRHGVYVKQR
jgi:hypothetical protein